MGEYVTCDMCWGEGTIVTCPDDICANSGHCIHGDGEQTCPECNGAGEFYDGDDDDWYESDDATGDGDLPTEAHAEPTRPASDRLGPPRQTAWAGIDREPLPEGEVNMTTELDWQNKPAPEDETDDTEILVWSIEPDPTGEYSERIVRGYSDMLNLVRDTAELSADGEAEAELRHGFEIKVRLVKMRLGDYRALPE